MILAMPKPPTKSEKPNINIARKSIVTIKKIKKGEYFNKENIGIKRPGNGISPYNWEKILGTKSNKNYKNDILLK
jgi:N,N'-diacetyllegionaminate synthase